jgi:hypothetical protein
MSDLAPYALRISIRLLSTGVATNTGKGAKIATGEQKLTMPRAYVPALVRGTLVMKSRGTLSPIASMHSTTCAIWMGSLKRLLKRGLFRMFDIAIVNVVEKVFVIESSSLLSLLS